MSLFKRGSCKSARTQVWFGRSPDELPNKNLTEFRSDIFASYSGPDVGLGLIQELQLNKENEDEPVNVKENLPSQRSTSLIAGAPRWNLKNRKAYGICMSLYDQHPVNGKISGDPVADAFGLCARENSAVLIVADGVNWGEKSKLAARCATFGCMNYINQCLLKGQKAASISTTARAFDMLLTSIDVAHDTILQYDGGLTTLCVALVCPLKESKQFVVCIVNVGDSLAFVFSRQYGVREVTTGSHDIRAERDIRDAGGAIGPVNGKDPELHNLTCSMTFVDPGDIVYLTTDGISDNFDPVVTKIAVAKTKSEKKASESLPADDGECTDNLNDGSDIDPGELEDGKPVMLPHERHQYAVKEMERVIHEFELFTESPCSAQELCGALLQHVLKLTDSKRKVLENPRLYGRKLKHKDREFRDREIVIKLSKSPGKLDHATIIGYEVGCYHGNEDEDYCIDEEEDATIVTAEPNQDRVSPSMIGLTDLAITEDHYNM